MLRNIKNTCKTKKHSHYVSAFSYNQRLPILPGRFQPSTFGVYGLNYRVRDGNGWIPTAIATEYTGEHPSKVYSLKTSQKKIGGIYQLGCSSLAFGTKRLTQTVLLAFAHNALVRLFKSSPRPISTSQLKWLPILHTWPINLVVYKGPY